MSPAASTRADGRSTRWEAHRRARRVELVDAALRAITRSGPDVAMDDIAAEAGTSKTVLYRHFADKGQLHRAVAARVDRRVLAALRAAVLGATGSRAALAAAITTYLHLVRDDPHVYRFVVSTPGVVQGPDGAVIDDPVTGLTSVVAAELGRLIAAQLSPASPMSLAVDAGDDERAASVRPWAHGLVALVRAAADTWVSQSVPSDADTLAEQLTALVWDGLGGVLRGPHPSQEHPTPASPSNPSTLSYPPNPQHPPVEEPA